MSTPRLEIRLHPRMDPTASVEPIEIPMNDVRVHLQDFDQVVQLYRPSIFRYLFASLRDRDAAETLTQECFLRAYQSREQFRAESAVKTWLMRIAVNLIRDRARNRRIQFWRRTQTSSADAQEAIDRLAHPERSPEAQALFNEQVRAVWRITERLPERQRAVFLLRFVEEMDLLEIAEVLRTTEGTVKKHLFRAMQAIREGMRRTK